MPDLTDATNEAPELTMFQLKLAHWPGILDDLSGDDFTEYTQGG